MKLNRRQLEDALQEVIKLCGEQGLDVRIVVVGGAAMALHYKMDRDPTRDVDCAVLATPRVHDQVFEIAHEVGRRLGFLDGWFNSGARLFLPDFGDLETLAEIIGVTTQEQARQIFDRFYPHDDMARHSSAWIQRRFAT